MQTALLPRHQHRHVRVRMTAKAKDSYACRAPRAWTHELALSLAAAVLTQVLPRLRDSSSNSGNSSSVRATAKVKGSHASRAPRAWNHELTSSLAAAVPTWVLP